MTAEQDGVVKLRPPRPCPICGKPSTREHYPFCSEACRERDLNRWLSGGYSIPVVEDDDAPLDEDEHD